MPFIVKRTKFFRFSFKHFNVSLLYVYSICVHSLIPIFASYASLQIFEFCKKCSYSCHINSFHVLTYVFLCCKEGKMKKLRTEENCYDYR